MTVPAQYQVMVKLTCAPLWVDVVKEGSGRTHRLSPQSWHWRIKSVGGVTVARGDRGYETREEAVAAAETWFDSPESDSGWEEA